MPKSLSIVAKAGMAVAALAIVISFIISFIVLPKNYPLTFEDSYGHRSDGDVYLNGKHLGRTQHGVVYLRGFKTGEVKIIAYKDGKSYINYYDLNPAEEGQDFIFEVDYSTPWVAPVNEENITQYLNALDLSNSKLRSEATKYIRDCPSGDIECQLIYVYEGFLLNYSYIADPRNEEHIQSPFETINYGGGDCEDLTILLISLLENIGIETYMVLEPEHVYALACGVDAEVMYNYTLPLFYTYDLVENSTEKIHIKGDWGWYYGGNDSFKDMAFTMLVNITANKPITVFAVNDEYDYQAFMYGEPYTYIQGTYRENVRSYNETLVVPATGGFVIFNPNKYGADIALRVESYLNYYGIDPKNLIIYTYSINSLTRKEHVPD